MNYETRMAQRRHELLTDLVSQTQKILDEHDVPKTAAVLAANSLADYMTSHWGGQVVNFPKDARWKLDKLEVEIYNKFRGNNYDELAREYGMTMSGMRKLIKRTRAKLSAGPQAGLFDPPDQG